MKFARLLRTTAEDLPELNCLFHIYKHLKKQLKQLPARSEGKGPADGTNATGKDPEEPAGDANTTTQQDSNRTASEATEEARFTAVLTDHLQRLNDRFLEREETCVIQLERLEAEAAQCSLAARAALAEAIGGAGPSGGYTVDANCDGGTVGSSQATLKAITDQRAQLYKRFVNFHGEVLLLVHWSVLAYTATVKILKKHHKRTGLLLRAPQLADLLSQPFCSSELMTGLARKAEACIQRLAEQLASSATSGETTEGETAGGLAGGGADGAGAVGSVAAASGGGGGPQVTVNQRLPPPVRALGMTAAGGHEPYDEAYGAADGSSPSCSQSMGEGVLLGAETVAAEGSAGVGHAAAAAAAAAALRGKRARAESSPQPQQLRRRRSGSGLAQSGGQQGQRGEGEGEEERQAGARALGARGAGIATRGASFLRNLTRISDNSAASLSGPYVLEQLAELQQYVDKYDQMDDDADMDDDLDDAEEDSAATAAGAGAGAAGPSGVGAAAAAAVPTSLGARSPHPHPHLLSTSQPAAHDHHEHVREADGFTAIAVAAAGTSAGGCHAPDLTAAAAQPAAAQEVQAAADAVARAASGPGVGVQIQEARAVSRGQSPQLALARAGGAGAAVPSGGAGRGGQGVSGQRGLAPGFPGEVGSVAGQTEESVEMGDAPDRTSPVSLSAAPLRCPSGQQHAHGLPHGAMSEEQDPQQQLLGSQHAQHAAAVAAGGAHCGGVVEEEGVGEGEEEGVTHAASRSGNGSGQGSAPADLPAAPQHARPVVGGGLGAPPQSSSGSAAATAGGAASASVALSEVAAAMFGGPRPLSAEPGASNLLRRTQVALTMWEQLRATASTPSTVIDPSAGQQQQPQLPQPQSHSPGVAAGGSAAGQGCPRGKRRRVLAGFPGGSGGAGAAAVPGQEDSQGECVPDDSDSNSD